jgi:hypothetical protein
MYDSFPIAVTSFIAAGAIPNDFDTPLHPPFSVRRHEIDHHGHGRP